MFERVFKALLVFERLAHGELKVEAVLQREVDARELRLHRLEICRAEANGLQVREAEPRLAELRREFEGAPVCREAVRLAPGALQRMAVAQPDLRVARVLREHAGIQLGRRIDVADPRQDPRLEVAIGGVARLAA